MFPTLSHLPLDFLDFDHTTPESTRKPSGQTNVAPMPSLSSTASTSVLSRLTGRRTAQERTTTPDDPSSSTTTAATPPSVDSENSDHQGRRPAPREPKRVSSVLSLSSSVSDRGGPAHRLRRSVSWRSHRTQPSSGSGSVGVRSQQLESAVTIASRESDEDETGADPAASFHSLPRPPSSTSPPTSASPSAATYAPRSRGKLAISTRSLTQKFRSTDTLLSLTRLHQRDTSLDRTGDALRSPVSTMHGHTLPKRTALERPSIVTNSSFAKDGAPSTSLQAAGPNGTTLQQVASTPTGPAGGHNPHATLQQIREVSCKRMATMDYMRKVHEGNVHFFNTLHYSTAGLNGLPSMHPLKAGRRAHNYLVLGNSLTSLIDTHPGPALDYLKALSTLLSEFETYQNLTGIEGAGGSSISRGRVGQMLKSGMSLGMGKGRRSSTATEALASPLTPGGNDFLSLPKGSTDAYSPTEPSPVPGNSSVGGAGGLASHHDFHVLQTPHIPFDPDLSLTLATLCDALIDAYARLLELVRVLDQDSATGTGEAFAKADKAARKLLVANVFREFEEQTRAGIKGEVAGVGRLVLGGLV